MHGAVRIHGETLQAATYVTKKHVHAKHTILGPIVVVTTKRSTKTKALYQPAEIYNQHNNTNILKDLRKAA